MSTVEVIFLAASVITLGTGLIIVAVNPWRSINRCYLIAATLSALWLFSIFVAINSNIRNDPLSSLFWLRMSNAFVAFFPWSHYLIKVAITESGKLTRILGRSWPWFLAGCALVMLVFTDSFARRNLTSGAYERGIAYSLFMAALAAQCTTIYFDARRKMRECTGIRRLELKFFVINVCICTLILLATFFASHLLGFTLLKYISPFVLLASLGLTIGAICYHRIFDARQAFAAIARRASTLLVLASATLITDSILSGLLSDSLALALSACNGGILALLWDGKVCRWLNLDMRQLLEKPRAEIMELAQTETDAVKLTAKFEDFLKDWCQAESVSIHTVDKRASSNLIPGTSCNADDFPMLRQTGFVTTETLARRRPDKETLASKAMLAERDLAALIAVPRGSHLPSCVAALGPKQSLRPYTYPDVQLLIELVELMDNILAQARAATQAAQLEKMESVALMSRGLAHDLNNLATPVSTFLLHMEDRIVAGTPEAEVLAHAQHSTQVMQDYIRESLFFARRHVPDFQCLSANEVLSSTVKLTQSRAQARGVDLRIAEAADLTFIADRVLMLRMMQNLVCNGIDATPRGGRVTLSGNMAENDRIVLSVTDQGPGVPAELVDRIFEPYFTTKGTSNEARGLGLGLAISRKISGLHGGRITVGKAPAGGAVFSFIAPPCPDGLAFLPPNPIAI